MRFTSGGHVMGVKFTPDTPNMTHARSLLAELPPLDERRAADRFAPEPLPPVNGNSYGDRLLIGSLVPWSMPTDVVERDGQRYREWFNGGSLRLAGDVGDVPLVEGHGGRRVGTVMALIHRRSHLDAAMLVDDGSAGDALLYGVELNRTPLSIGFELVGSQNMAMPGTNVMGRMITRGTIFEVSIGVRGQYEMARVRARTNRGYLTDLARSK
jgi:hypothetical protein